MNKTFWPNKPDIKCPQCRNGFAAKPDTSIFSITIFTIINITIGPYVQNTKVNEPVMVHNL
jgi:hypothetical protein